MFFRNRGNRIQCLRSYYDKGKGRGGQDVIFSFLESTDDIKEIDLVLRKRLTEEEDERLKNFLSKDRQLVENLIDQTYLCSISMRKKSFDKTCNVKELKKALIDLNKTIMRVGL